MTAVFADAFYYFALLNPKDAAHQKATHFAKHVSRNLLTTEWVLTEVGDGLSQWPRGRLAFVRLYAELVARPDVRIVPFSAELFAAGLELYAQRPDKEWSLTDCISFVVMTRDGVSEALTGDKHFEQAGFHKLL